MKTNLTIFALFIVLGASAQTKHERYFYYTCTFQSTDGCTHDQFGKFTNYGKNPYGYDEIYTTMSAYVRPYKLVKGTFKINEYRQLSRKEWLTYKANKFEPCKDNLFRLSSNASIVDTLLKFNSIQWSQPSYSFITVVQGKYQHVLTVSDPDSSKTITVTFSKSAVHFLNDSTFTYKQ